MATADTQICELCDTKGLERTHFFPRQLVTAPDLTQDQLYFREKLRRHNRLLHGWGVVCGARCKRGAGTCDVVIEPGYLLGPYGDEILIDREVTINVCTQDLDGNAAGPCGQPSDPWCSNVRIDRQAGDKVYVAVRYAECQDRPVRVISGGCGCDGDACEYTRIRDSYVIRVLSKLPSTYDEVMKPPDVQAIWACVECGRPCPPCPAEPWVILADLTLGTDGGINFLDCFAHRRYVASLAGFYFMCKALRLRSLRLTDISGRLDVPVKDPKSPLKVPVARTRSAIEVTFENALLDPKTVGDTTFKVESLGGPAVSGVAGKMTVASSQDSVRWVSDDALKIGRYRLTLVGTGADAVKSDAGTPLDGEPTQLPSGDGCPGGDFTFEFEIVRAPIG